ncbi:MAG: hypothetical protein O2820_10605 [Planctomycetota bacterium]|nr:hypothetical protein [Planctomycetota bacterium]MDA1249660.1 hypothetical protein [Planctomycetota bacterium]
MSNPITISDTATSEASTSTDPAAPLGPGINLGELGELRRRNSARSKERFQLERPAALIPVSLDGMLDHTRQISGSSREISLAGISIEVPTGSFHASQPLLLGLHLEGEGEGAAWAGLIVRRVEQLESGSTLVGADFGGPASDVLSAGSLVPSFDQNLLAFTLPESPAVYDNWAAAGVMQKVLLDKAMVCPQCGALPTFRNACRKCGSGRVTNDRLIHHFACAHVDFVQEFETGDGQLVCPKCRLKKLVIGSDFEYLIGEYRCQSCAWRDSDIQLYGHCLRCNNRFESHQAREQELHQYHVHRLDPLAVTARLG